MRPARYSDRMARIVAVVGASRDRRKFGNKAVRAFAAAGDTVVPIHPTAAEIEGLRAYRSVVDVPGPIDMATVYLPPDVAVTVLPGASAVETALVASGFASERYQFLGYLPRGEAALVAVWDELRRWPWPAVAFESPRRLPRTLASLAGALPERPVAVCRELTKQFEEVVRGNPSAVAERFSEPPKGEITVVLGPSAESASSKDEDLALAALDELVSAGLARRQGADLVARLTGMSRNVLYRRSL